MLVELDLSELIQDKFNTFKGDLTTITNDMKAITTHEMESIRDSCKILKQNIMEKCE